MKPFDPVMSTFIIYKIPLLVQQAIIDI